VGSEVRDPRFFFVLGDSLSRPTVEVAAVAGESSRRCLALERPRSVYGTCCPGATPRPGTEVLCKALPACTSDAAGSYCGSLLLGSCSSLRDCSTATMVPRTLLLLCFCLLVFPSPGTGIFLLCYLFNSVVYRYRDQLVSCATYAFDCVRCYYAVCDKRGNFVGKN
jgi:hypothetical protein